MNSYYICGTTLQPLDDLGGAAALFEEMTPYSGYKAIGMMDEAGNICDIIVEKNGDLFISKDYQTLGWEIDKDFWADLFFKLETARYTKESKKEYWWLPLDSYNQPNGQVVTLALTEEEFRELKNRGQYVFDSYYQACLRAQD